MKYLLLISILCLLSLSTYSQSDTKFGKISEEILTMTNYDKDSTASAVILYDAGRSYFTYSNTEGFQVNFERTCRIKIFNNNGFDYANIKIDLYKSGTDKESIQGFKAFTYNLEDGEIVKEKVGISDLFEEEVNSHWIEKKVAMPNIKSGSVIDVQYTIVSGFLYNLQPWQFQYDIPVIYSEYVVTIPEFYNYKNLLRGYLSFSKNSTSDKSEKFPVSYNTTPQAGGNIETVSYNLESDSKIYEYVMENIPAFKTEPYITTSKNYISKLIFELKSIKYPNQSAEYITTSWSEVTKEMLESTYFGKQLEKTKFIEETTASIIKNIDSSELKMIAIYDFVRNKMLWNEECSQFVFSTLEKAYEAQTGNSADINLLLTLMLKIAGINAKPVVLSTRYNGLLYPDNPSITSFNYVICVGNINGTNYFLDATEKNCPAGLLPKRCLNGNGRYIDIDLINEIEINPEKTSIETIQIQLKLSVEGKMSGTITQKFENNIALEMRNKINESLFEEYVKEIESKYTDLKIDSFEITNLEDIYSNLLINYDVAINEAVTVGRNNIYLNPMLGFGLEENPFKLDTREYPVDFAYPFTDKYLFSITIPDGYEIDEIPENLILPLSENSGKFMYSVTQIGKTLQVVSLIQINNSIYNQTEYTNLKEFYSQIVAKHAELIVLKKI
jgi:transglutaminase-like putative cysteine protease